MPLGISPVPKYFQQKLDQNLEDLPGVFRIFDDLLITDKGSNIEEVTKDHDRNLRKLLGRRRQRNIKLNKDGRKDRPQAIGDDCQEAPCCCSKTFTASYDETNAV